MPINLDENNRIENKRNKRNKGNMNNGQVIVYKDDDER